MFDQLEVNRDLLCGHVVSFIGFENIMVHPIGEINLTLSIGVHLRRASLTTMFTMVDCPSYYNLILGRLFLTEMDMTINQRMLVMKFSTLQGWELLEVIKCP